MKNNGRKMEKTYIFGPRQGNLYVMFTCSFMDDHCAFVIHTDDVVAPRLRKLILGIRRSAKKWLVIMV